jgi:dinuclear metal center YbgI/SA1388 family protein
MKSMISVRDVCSYLESFAPPSYQESYDNSGLITGDSDSEVSGVLICLDSTEEVIMEAKARGCNLVIAHHPIIFSGLKKITGRNYVERAIIAAIRNDIAIFAAHTNMDNVSEGVNRIISDRLGLQDCRVLSPKYGLLKKLVTYCPPDHAEAVRSALFRAGAGRIGNYDECSFNVGGTGTFRGSETSKPFAGVPGVSHKENEIRIEVIFEKYRQKPVLESLFENHPYEEVAYDIYSLDNQYQEVGSGMIGELPEPMDERTFLEQVKEKMQAGCVRHTPLLGRRLQKVALCGGSGSFLLEEAIRAGADIFISADFKYHQFFDADGKIVIADIGHFESEQYTIQLFKSLILKKFSTFAVRLTEVDTNPVHYI